MGDGAYDPITPFFLLQNGKMNNPVVDEYIKWHINQSYIKS